MLLESVNYWREIGDRSGLAEALSQLGELSRRDNNQAAARTYWSESLSIQLAAGDRSSVAGLLEAFADLSAADGDHDRAARMFGLAASIREEISNPIRPSSRSRYEQSVEIVKISLGRERFEQAWAEGECLPIEQALQLTHLTPDPSPGRSQAR